MSKNNNKNYIIRCGLLIDGTENEPQQNVSISIEDSKILDIGSEGTINTPEGAQIIDAQEKTVMPGMIDSHMHFLGLQDQDLIKAFVDPQGVRLLRTSVHAKNLLDAGFTTVRDMSSSNGIPLKLAINEGTIRGPRILSAGPTLTMTGGHGDFLQFLPYEWVKTLGWSREEYGTGMICDGIAECMRAARLNLRNGADFIKIEATGGVFSQKDKPTQAQFTPDEIEAIVNVVTRAETFAAAHCIGSQGMYDSVKAGVKTIEHAFFPTQEIIEMGLKKQTVFVPTLSVLYSSVHPSAKGVIPDWAWEKAHMGWDVINKNISNLREAGCIIAMGTDISVGNDTTGLNLMGHGCNAKELELLVKFAGFSFMDAIRAATWGGSKACGLENQIGTLQKGKIADLLIIDGDPLKDVKILQEQDRIQMVFKEGKIMKNLV